MEVVKIDDKNFAVYKFINGIRTYCQFIVPKISSPFGVEEFNKVHYVNFELDMGVPFHSQLLGDIYKTERELQDYLTAMNVSAEWVSSVKKNGNFHPLWKVRVPKRRGRIMVKTSIPFHEIDFKAEMGVKIKVHSIWVYGNKAGVVYHLEELELV